VKALSIRQPWAWLIVNGYKNIKNRTWPTKFRGRVLIHAGKGMTHDEYDDVEDFLMFSESPTMQSIRLPSFAALERGGIVGVATITGCTPSVRRSSPWHIEGQFGFEIADTRALPFLECKGALGFFNVSAEVSAALREMHTQEQSA
jgi:hypothetical protein